MATRTNLYRIGAVSKLSGVPVPTLRVWQTRYNAFSPATSTGLHRLYDEQDLHKAVLLKALTGQGHGISLIAGLTPPQLQELLQTGDQLTRGRSLTQPADKRPTQWAVIGNALAKRLQSAFFQTTPTGPLLGLQQVWADLETALSQANPQSFDVLMVSVNTLNSATAEQIMALQRMARQTVVLYGFGQKEAIASLSRAGCKVHRETLNDEALADILRSARPPLPDIATEIQTALGSIPRRQFSDAVLQRVANIPSQVLCECPRHVAELIGQLGRFEDYSQDCLQQSPKDGELHLRLNTMAATARALLEQALQMVAEHEGISLQDAP